MGKDALHRGGQECSDLIAGSSDRLLHQVHTLWPLFAVARLRRARRGRDSVGALEAANLRQGGYR